MIREGVCRILLAFCAVLGCTVRTGDITPQVLRDASHRLANSATGLKEGVEKVIKEANGIQLLARSLGRVKK